MLKQFIGTSGWNYSHWQGIFYPEDLAENKWLLYYTNFFNCVELNVTFYRLPKKEIFLNWYKKTPKDFFFVAKGSRFITHIKKLKDIEKPLDLFMRNVAYLKEKLVACLWQFPPQFKKDIKRIENFLKLLKKTGIRQAFEFRNTSFFMQDIYSLLKKYNFCLCIAHSEYFPCVKEITSDFIYLRFHGGNLLYSSNYSDKELKAWADFAQSTKKDIFAFFNNDAQGFAVKNALRFKELLKH